MPHTGLYGGQMIYNYTSVIFCAGDGSGWPLLGPRCIYMSGGRGPGLKLSHWTL